MSTAGYVATAFVLLAAAALASGRAHAQPAAPQTPSGAPTVVPVEQAPYHVPVLGNDLVTVLNVFIPPGRTSGYHRHSRDTLGVLLADTDRTTQPPGGEATVAPLRPRGTVTFSFYGREPHEHSVTVRGDGPFHNVVVELRESAAAGRAAGTRDGAAGYTLLLDNERVRAWRLELDPGERAGEITQLAPGIRVVVQGGELVERVPGRPDRGLAPHAGEFYWQEAGVTRAVENIGRTRVEIVEVEIK